MCSTEVNLEVVEVLMFLAGSYSEIWGCLFYSVNMLKMTQKLLFFDVLEPLSNDRDIQFFG